MKQFLFQIIAITLVIVGSLFFSFNKDAQNTLSSIFQTKNKQINLNITKSKIKLISSTNTSMVNVEIADTESLRTRGLGYRASLPNDSGMLFIFDKAQKYKFWMKGMNFPLDLIWISGDTVVDLTLGVPPEDPNLSDASLKIYQPSRDVNKVLEVNSGFVELHNIKLGDKLEF